jgi:hypothetical protein
VSDPERFKGWDISGSIHIRDIESRYDLVGL